MSGFNQKLHLIVDTFVECLKSLLGNCTESEFKMAIQQQLKLYEKFLFEPETLTDDLSACAAGRRNLPIYEKIKYLCSATFADFQEFYQKFIEKMRIKALIQGNVTKSHALNIVNKMLTELKFEKIENVSIQFEWFFIHDHWFWSFQSFQIFLAIFNRAKSAQIAKRFELFAMQKF